MTILFLQPWNGYQVGQQATLGAPTEGVLTAGGIATADLDMHSDDYRLAHFNADGTALIGPNGNSIPLAGGQLVQSVSFAAASAPIDLSLGNIINIGTLTGDLTLASPINAVADTFYTYNFQQDGTGGHLVNFPNSVTYGFGTAGQKLVVQFFYDGIDFLQVFGGA